MRLASSGVAQGFEAAGEALEGAHAARRIASGRDGRHQFLRAHVNPGRLGMDAGVDGVLAGTGFVFGPSAGLGLFGHWGCFWFEILMPGQPPKRMVNLLNGVFVVRRFVTPASKPPPLFFAKNGNEILQKVTKGSKAWIYGE